MAVRARELMRRGAAWSEAVRGRPWLIQGAYLLLGLPMGAARLFGGPGPFGLAAVAASGFGLGGFLCLMGVITGYLIGAGLLAGVRYVATSLLIFTAGFVTQGLAVRRQRWFMPLLAAVLTGATGLLYARDEAGSVPGLMRVFLEVVLSGGCAWFFGLVLDPERAVTEAAELRRTIAAAVLTACALMGLGPVELFGTASIGRAAAVICVMAAGFCGGPLSGCAVGAAMGTAMDLAAGAALFYGAAYPLAGLAAGGLYRYGRLAFSMSFCAANAVAVLMGWTGAQHVGALYECFIASVIFMLLPQSVLTPVSAFLRVGRGRGETAFRLYQAQRLEHLSEGFRRLYDCASRPEPDRDRRHETGAVYDRAADAVCRSCERKNQCWKKDYAQTVQGFANLEGVVARKGSVSAADLPEHFRENCLDPVGFAAAINGEMRGLMYRRQYRARLKEGRAAAYGQFMDMAEVIRDAAKEMSGDAGPDGEAERRLMRYMKSRELEGVCSVFRDGRGRLHGVLEGEGVQTLLEEPDCLERLSQVVGVRLALAEGQAPGRLALHQAEPLAVSVGVASMKKEGESVSGDLETYFKTAGGLLCIILSDGMGTGEQAAGESRAAVEILQELLMAGVEPGCAMRLLNSASMLKNGEDWGYATVDLCCIDLFTGQAGFYKYGAAPSYVKTGRAIRRVKCTSLAAGMLAGEGSAPDVMRMRLRPGNIALIASDGVLAERNDQWLRDILAGADGMDTKTLARDALQAAAARFGSADDMTALAIRVEERQ